MVEPDRAALTELARMIDTGDLMAIVGRACTLDDGAALITSKHRGDLPGKIVITLGE